MAALAEQRRLRRPLSLSRLVREMQLPREVVHRVDTNMLQKGQPSPYHLVCFVQSASAESLAFTPDQNPEEELWKLWGNEVSVLFVQWHNGAAQNTFIGYAAEILTPFQQIALVSKLWLYGERGSDRKGAVEKLIHAFWKGGGKFARDNELLNAVTEFSLGLPKDLAERLPDPIRERITVVEEPPETEFLD